MNCITSDSFQQVVACPSLTGAGNLPSFTHCQIVDLETGIIGGIPFALSPTICESRNSLFSSMVISLLVSEKQGIKKPFVGVQECNAL
jgi:hypothetical protein